VHAWDHLKWKVEAGDLRHQACLEVCYSDRIGGGSKGANEMDIDSSIDTIRRMPLCARILHQEPMAVNRATTALRPPSRDIIFNGETRRQGRCTRCEDCERGVG
jgi:hypothetical protein